MSQKFKNPYFMKNTAKKISTIINNIKLNRKLFNKKFFYKILIYVWIYKLL